VFSDIVPYLDLDGYFYHDVLLNADGNSILSFAVKMHTLSLLTCLYGSLVFVVSAAPLAEFTVGSDDILLKLDYATYRGDFNSTTDVRSVTSP
jgi:hypothetical protein